MEIIARNVNDAFLQGVQCFIGHRPVQVAPRGKRTLEMPEPVTTLYMKPTERVLFDGARDCNPFLHLFEAVWLLAGRRDLKFMRDIAPQFAEYSDDAVTMQGSYGFRWREWFDFDQIKVIIKTLREDPETRRAVLTMWSPSDLVGRYHSKDIPCNTQVYFKLRDRTLRMTVTCRSNDMIWGAYGANAVQFSLLQEYIADKVGAMVGMYAQVSDSFHVYLDGKEGAVWGRVAEAHAEALGAPVKARCPYATGTVRAAPLGANTPAWDGDMMRFFETYDKSGLSPMSRKAFTTCWWQHVLIPMWNTFLGHKLGDRQGLSFEEDILAADWRLAVTEWLERRTK